MKLWIKLKHHEKICGNERSSYLFVLVVVCSRYSFQVVSINETAFQDGCHGISPNPTFSLKMAADDEFDHEQYGIIKKRNNYAIF